MKIVANTVSAFVYRRGRDGPRFLLLKRSPLRGGFWQSVSGNVRRGERPERAAARETGEETGLRVTRVLNVDFINAYYIKGRIWLEPCFGVEVDTGRVVLSREHVAYRWVGPREALRLLRWPGNRAAFAALLDELRRARRRHGEG